MSSYRLKAPLPAASRTARQPTATSRHASTDDETPVRTTSRSATSTATIGSTTAPARAPAPPPPPPTARPPPPAPPPPHPYTRPRIAPRRRPRMPANPRRPTPYEDAGSEAINAMVARVAPSILELLGDGVPRRKP